VRTIFLIVVPVLLLFCLGMVLIWVPLPQPFPAAAGNGRNTMAAVVVGILGLVYVIGLTGYVCWAVFRSGRVLDDVLASIGMTASGNLGLRRRYHGRLHGYNVRASWVPGYGVRPSQFLANVVADVGLVAAVGDHHPLRPSADAIRVKVPVLENWTPVVLVKPDHAARLTDFLAAEESARGLHMLLAASEPGGVRELSLAPDRIWFRARPNTEVAVQRAGEWVQKLVILAAQLEHAEESR